MNRRKVIVVITGAGGAVYALELPGRLRGLPEVLPDCGLAVVQSCSLTVM